MRMVQMSLCTGLLVAGGLMVSAAERGQEPVRSGAKASLRDTSLHDASVTSEPVADALAAIAAAASACEPVGAWNDQFAGTNRFRGNV